MNKTKGLENTYEKTADGGRGIFGKKQDRMKLRTAKNVVNVINLTRRYTVNWELSQKDK